MRRPVIFLGLALLACLIVFVTTAGAALDPTDTATGTGALASENGGVNNTADGFDALYSNISGAFNTASGWQALFSNQGYFNTAYGATALQYNLGGNGDPLHPLGDFNVAVGYEALLRNTSGGANTASGTAALDSNTTGMYNTAVGGPALDWNTTGDKNTAVGFGAGDSGSGKPGNASGSDDTYLGSDTGPATTPTPNLSNATAVGANAKVGENNALVLGASGVVTGIGTTTPESLLQVGQPSTSYGQYLQIPMVTNSSGPPIGDCHVLIRGGGAITFAGRLVLQYDAQKVRTTLWSCSAGGIWTKLAQG
jgi:hypothetical protein